MAQPSLNPVAQLWAILILPDDRRLDRLVPDFDGLRPKARAKDRGQGPGSMTEGPRTKGPRNKGPKDHGSRTERPRAQGTKDQGPNPKDKRTNARHQGASSRPGSTTACAWRNPRRWTLRWTMPRWGRMGSATCEILFGKHRRPAIKYVQASHLRGPNLARARSPKP